MNSCQHCAALSAVEQILALKSKVNELSRIARLELLMQQILYVTWSESVDEAVKNALAAQSKTNKVNDVVAAVDKAMSKWPNNVEEQFTNSIEQIYKLGRVVGWKRATKKIKGKHSLMYEYETTKAKKAFDGFNVADETAIEALSRLNFFWVGQHYENNVSQAITSVVKKILLESGLPKAKAGRKLEGELKTALHNFDVPLGYKGTSKSYFEMVAANSATTSRVAGQIESFKTFDVATLEVVNPDDEKTTPICKHMNGKIFTIEQASKQLENLYAAETPDDVKSAQPWVDYKTLASISSQPGEASKGDIAALASANIILPPYHPNCRTTVDVASFK